MHQLCLCVDHSPRKSVPVAAGEKKQFLCSDRSVSSSAGE